MLIKITRLGQVGPGDMIAHVDDEEITQEEINSDYLAEEQDWQKVRGVKGHADVGYLLLEAYDGSREWHPCTWDGLVWLAVEDDGVTPLVADSDDDD